MQYFARKNFGTFSVVNLQQRMTTEKVPKSSVDFFR